MDLYQQFIYKSRYARWLWNEKRRENWEETVDRYLEYMQSHLKKHHNYEFNKIGIDNIRDNIVNLEVMPSMRALMTSGKALDRDQSAAFNCSFITIDTPKAFDELMYLLMCGTGVGFSVERQFANSLPEIPDELYKTESTIVVTDSKIGWAKALRELISILYNGGIPNIDYSKIRPAGSPLKTFGGRASGASPLKETFNYIINIFKNAKGRKLNSLECHDICCKIASAVICGGVRRSALLSLSNLSDDRMRNAKNGNWYEYEKQRSFANDSVAYTEKPEIEIFIEEWLNLMKSKSGERGIFNREGSKKFLERITPLRNPDKEWGLNPSLRKGTKVLTQNGIFNIEDLENTEFNLTNLNKNISLAKCFLSGKNKKLWKIVLEGNHEYYCTQEHKWAVYKDSKTQEYEKFKTSDIPENSYLPVIQKDKLYDHINGTRDEGFLIGWNLGDGWITKRKDTGKTQIGFMVSEEDNINFNIKNKLEEIFKSFDSNAKFNSNGEVNIQHKNITKLFEKFGVQHKSFGLPKTVWNNSSEEFRKGLLDGLFSSDGCFSDRVSITSSNKQLLNDISELLGFYGINTTIRGGEIKNISFPNGKKYDRKYFNYILTITRNSIHHFKKIIGNITNHRKNESFDKLLQNAKNTTCDRIKIKSIEETDIYEDVWDISVYDDIHCFELSHCVTGNCGEILLQNASFCNLSEVVCRENDSLEDLKKKVEIAVILGTYQSTLTNFRYLRKEWKKNCDEERLLGVSLTGTCDCKLLQNTDFRTKVNLAKLRKHAININKEIANKFGINQSVSVTCTKPSGCRTKNALTTTDSGIYLLKEFFNDNSNQWDNISTKNIFAEQNNNKNLITKTYNNGLSNIVKIKMNYNYEIECTPNHKWYVKYQSNRNHLRNKDINDWIETSNLSIGDVLDINIDSYKNETNYKFKEYNIDNVREQNNQIKFPEYMNEDISWLLGYLWGNGCMSESKYRIRFSDGDIEKLNKVSNIMNNYFNLYRTPIKRNDNNSYYLDYSSHKLWEWLKIQEINKYDDEWKLSPIPKCVRYSSKNDIISFLSGLMIDSDGCVHIRNNFKRFTWSSAYDEFAQHIQEISWSVGIVVGRSLNSKGKNKQKEKHVWLLGNTTHGNLDSFKILSRNSVKLINLEKENPESKWLCESKSNKGRKILGKIIDIEFLNEQKETFDVEVENEHWYYHGSIKSHNTVSQLVNSSSGIHPRYSNYYIRRVRGDISDPLVRFLMETTDIPYEKDIINKTNIVFSFPIKSPDNAIFRNDRTAIEQLEYWKQFKLFWCTHNPSVSIYVKDDEWLEVANWVYNNFDLIGGISFFPHSDFIYQQAPYEEINEEEYLELKKSIPLKIDWDKLSEYEKTDYTTGSHELACTGGSCELVDIGNT